MSYSYELVGSSRDQKSAVRGHAGGQNAVVVLQVEEPVHRVSIDVEEAQSPLTACRNRNTDQLQDKLRCTQNEAAEESHHTGNWKKMSFAHQTTHKNTFVEYLYIIKFVFVPFYLKPKWELLWKLSFQLVTIKSYYLKEKVYRCSSFLFEPDKLNFLFIYLSLWADKDCACKKRIMNKTD